MMTPTRGAAGGALTATANWSAPLSNGGSPITGYRVRALRMAAGGSTVAGTPRTMVVSGSARSAKFTLPAGGYRFEVTATNAVGSGPASTRSTLVQPR
jgi:hypothetical protein